MNWRRQTIGTINLKKKKEKKRRKCVSSRLYNRKKIRRWDVFSPPVLHISPHWLNIHQSSRAKTSFIPLSIHSLTEKEISAADGKYSRLFSLQIQPHLRKTLNSLRLRGKKNKPRSQSRYHHAPDYNRAWSKVGAKEISSVRQMEGNEKQESLFVCFLAASLTKHNQIPREVVKKKKKKSCLIPTPLDA